MNAADTIRAAIAKLEGLRGLQGSWTIQGGGEWIHPIGITVAPDDGGVTGRVADLIVTLHRTIDAQLAILQNALIDFYSSGQRILADTIDLATAILGEES